MEGLRGLAVVLVFAVHFCTLVRPWAADPGLVSVLDVLERLGHSGVDLFFVLSGYLIYGALIARPRPFGPFMRRRVQRIYPTFLAVFALYLVLSLLDPSHSKLPAPGASLVLFLLSNLLLLPGIFPLQPLIAVAWSLSYEMFYYIAMPALIGLLHMRGMPSGRRAGLFIALAMATLVGCAAWSGPIRMAMFIAGVLLYEAMNLAPNKRVPAWLVLVALVAAALVDVLRPDGALGYALRTALLFIAFGLLCGACFMQPEGPLARGFTWTPLRWLGNMSYSYYLIHGLTLQAIFMLLGKLWVPPPMTGLALIFLAALTFSATLISSAVLFLLVERPLSLLPGQQDGPRVAVVER